MPNKITKKDLNNLVNLLKAFTDEDYQISSAYGGYKLVKILDNKGSEKHISKGYISKSELYRQIEMYFAGLEAGINKSKL